MNKKFNFLIAMTVIFALIAVGCTTNGDEDVVNNDDTDTSEEEVVVDDTEEVEDEDNDDGIVTDDNEELKKEIEKLKSENEELRSEANSRGPSSSMSLLQTSLAVMDLIKNKDMQGLATYVHPNKGLRFTPYFYVDIQNDQVFNTQQVEGLVQDTGQYTWGQFDGTGDPIEYNFNDYYDEFVYDEDYINPHMIGNNTGIGSGNIIDNVPTEYPDGEFVEFHFTGFDSQYEGMDWRSLRLVFEEHAGAWHLVGIVHGQWTI